MARSPRVRAEQGFYHVVLRGSGRQIIFECDGDRRLFLLLARECLGDAGINVLAWCLMSNHVHLLLEDSADELSHAMHRLAGRYAAHFNRLTGHVGHVFDGRFKSVPVTSDRQLLQVVRYIHDNPARAGICRAEEYPWSSYAEYAGGATILARTGTVLDMLGGSEGFVDFSAGADYLGYAERLGARVSDDEALAVAREALGDVEPSALKAMGRAERDRLLQLMRDAGLTIRQVERLTGIGRSTISHATHRRRDA